MQLSDFASPEFYADPYPMYAKLRAAGEILPLGPTLWLATGHHLVDALLCDRRMGRSYLKGVATRYGADKVNEPVFQAFRNMMLMQNPPEHSRLRGALMQAFNLQRMGELTALVQEICDELVEEIIAKGAADVMASLALPLPVRVICRLLDVPYADIHIFTQASNYMVNALELAPLDEVRLANANAATLQLQSYFHAIVAQRRLNPGQDLISVLLKIQQQDAGFSDAELIDNVILLFLAGHETTANMFGNALIALHRHPAQWRLLLENPSLVSDAINECVRFDSSVQLSQRVALEDVTIAGRDFKQGQAVYLLLGSANRDPAAFSSAEQLNIQRSSDEGRVLSFGGGLHFCLGARLAALELETLLATVVHRLPSLQLTHLEQLQWHARNTLRGVERLSATWSTSIGSQPFSSNATQAIPS